MRRTLFYLSVALLAFGIGSFFAAKFWAKNSDSIIHSVPPVREDIIFACPILSDNQTTEVSCDDKVINTVWEMLMKNKSFLNDAYINVVQARQIKDCRELFDVKPTQLNDDGNKEFLVIGNYLIFCDSGGDCQTWIVAKINNQYKIVFYSTAGTSTTKLYPHNEIETLDIKTHGLKDLKVFIPNGWDADNLGYFKFDGKKYQLRKCLRDFNSAYVYDSDYDEEWLGVKTNECLKRNFF